MKQFKHKHAHSAENMQYVLIIPYVVRWKNPLTARKERGEAEWQRPDGEAGREGDEEIVKL